MVLTLYLTFARQRVEFVDQIFYHLKDLDELNDQNVLFIPCRFSRLSDIFTIISSKPKVIICVALISLKLWYFSKVF